MAKQSDFNSFLTHEGQIIYRALLEHCSQKLKMMDVDTFELSMLANAFAMYADAAKVCNGTGVSFTIHTEKGGEYEQIRPEYTVMRNEYQNVIKHSSKFGLNPGDRAKFFKGAEGKKVKGLEAKMKAA